MEMVIGSRKFLAIPSKLWLVAKNSWLKRQKMWCGFWKPRRKFGYVAGRIWPAQTNHFQTFSAGCKNWCGFWKPNHDLDVPRAGNPFSPWAQRVWGWWVRSKPIELWLGLGFWKPNRDPGAQQRGRSVIDCCVVIWGVLYRGCAFGARCGGCALGVRFSFDTPPCILEDAGFIGLGRTLPPVIP